jgi:predicted dehydrogenase
MTSRRSFLLTAAGLALSPVLAGCAHRGPGGMMIARAARRNQEGGDGLLQLACVGVGNRGWDNVQEVRNEHIVALCDVDSLYLGRARAAFPQAKAFTDYRELLSRHADIGIDGIVIATPDHTHFPIAKAALLAGLPVYCEKPLTHTREQAVELRELAAKAGVPTQMGTQIHATANYRRVVEAVRGGAIGRITAVDCWQQKSWGGGRLTPGAVAPKQLDWNLWLGDEPRVAYIEGIHPANWRRYWAYGTGTLGDMGCHILDLPVWALGLAPCADMPGSGVPREMHVQAEGPPADAVGTPEWLEVSWAIPGAAGEGNDPLVLRWFDGGRISPFVQEIGAKDRQDYHGRFSVCFQGTQGAIFANYDEMLVWPPARAAEWYGRTAEEALGPAPGADGKPVPRPTLTPMPGSPAAGVPLLPPSRGHHAEWLQAIREGKPDAPLCNFAYGGRLTELVLAGTEAYRAGKPIRVTV